MTNARKSSCGVAIDRTTHQKGNILTLRIEHNIHMIQHRQNTTHLPHITVNHIKPSPNNHPFPLPIDSTHLRNAGRSGQDTSQPGQLQIPLLKSGPVFATRSSSSAVAAGGGGGGGGGGGCRSSSVPLRVSQRPLVSAGSRPLAPESGCSGGGERLVLYGGEEPSERRSDGHLSVHEAPPASLTDRPAGR